MAEEKKSTTLGEHIESLGNMSFPITGRPKVDKILTRVVVLGVALTPIALALTNWGTLASIVMDGVDYITDLIHTE